MNKNVAGSYAPSSIRGNHVLAAMISFDRSNSDQATSDQTISSGDNREKFEENERKGQPYFLAENHAGIVFKEALNGVSLPALPIAIFLLRDFGFVMEEPELDYVIQLFFQHFGITAKRMGGSVDLFDQSTAGFSDSDLVEMGQ